ADAAKVRQCLRNLLGNACKFTERGTVSLAVTRAPVDGAEWITVRVADTGIGMTEAHLATLFQPFTQVDPSDTRKYGGAGPRLATPRSFCEMRGGDIGVDSELGRGTTVPARLPAVAPAGPAAGPGPAGGSGDARPAAGAAAGRADR